VIDMNDEERRDDVSPPEGSPTAEAARDSDPNDIDGLRAKLRDEREKAQSYLSSWQRAAADFQNLKRRMEDERSEVGRIANAAFVINLLPLVDDLERALHTVDSNLAGLTWIDGVWLIYRKFQQVLENAGVREIQAEGQAFDPKVHEAISEAPGDEGKVVSVVQRGYMLGDRVVRPAMVVVGRGQGSGVKGQGEEQGTRNEEQNEEQGDTQEDLSG
jgi:molecular chaperone GrpE